MATAIPGARFGLISGSPTWGIDFPRDLHEDGVRVLQPNLTFDTPWGPSARWQLLELSGTMTASGEPRLVLNVFSHGQPLDSIDHASHRQVGWVMARAGVSKVVAESTCGSINRAVQPGDIAIPGDVLDLSQTLFSALPGRFEHACRGAQLLCPQIGDALEQVARVAWPTDFRVFGRRSGLIVAHQAGPRFETPAESAALRLLGGDLANQSIATDATAMREQGICFAALTFVTNYVDGVLPGAWQDDRARRGTELGTLTARIVLRALGMVSLATDCGCPQYRALRSAEVRRRVGILRNERSGPGDGAAEVRRK